MPRWKLPFSHSSSSSSSSTTSSSSSVHKDTVPMSFLCPISSTLMSDPVIVPPGTTFERACIEACSELGFTPPSLSSSSSISLSSFLLIPNSALKSAIIDWCDRSNIPHPSPISPQTAHHLVRTLMNNSVASPPPPAPPNFQQHPSKNIIASPSASEYSCSDPSSSSSNSASSSSNSEPVQNPTPAPTSSTTADPLEEDILGKIKSPQIGAKELGLMTLRQLTRESSERRISLCTPPLLAAVVPMILASNSKIQNNATAAVVNLSIEFVNKVKIVRAGAIPPLVHVLKSPVEEEARGNAAGAMFSLALEDGNKLAIGVLGAIPPLLSLFGSAGYGQAARVEAGMALYHLSLAPNNLSKIAKVQGAVKGLLHVAANSQGNGDEEETSSSRRRQLRRVVMMVLASLARRDEGRAALMDAGAVKAMVEMMRGGQKLVDEDEDEEEVEYYCLGVMYELSKGGMSSMRFRALARAVGAEEVLQLLLAKHGEVEGRVGKEMAKKILKVISGNVDKGSRMMMLLRDDEIEDDNEEGEEVASVVSDGLLTFRRRFDGFGSNSPSNSANF